MNKLSEFKEKFPDIYQGAFDEGLAVGIAKGEESGSANGIAQGEESGIAKGVEQGAKAERERIMAVEEQLIPGHEDLIAALKIDGSTTGEQAAVKVLQAEKALRSAKADQMAADGITPVNHALIPDDGTPPAKDFTKLVEDYQTEHNCSKGKAISAIAQDYPKEHAQYLTTINKGDK